jgi:pimeloyl-ACP methyl ester carboxylesterase
VTGLLPHARLVVIPRAAHAVNYDTPDELAVEVLRFSAALGDKIACEEMLCRQLKTDA